jgi:hypothetical protein
MNMKKPEQTVSNKLFIKTMSDKPSLTDTLQENKENDHRQHEVKDGVSEQVVVPTPPPGVDTEPIRMILDEILDTERTYVNYLKLYMEIYVVPLQNMVWFMPEFSFDFDRRLTEGM